MSGIGLRERALALMGLPLALLVVLAVLIGCLLVQTGATTAAMTSNGGVILASGRLLADVGMAETGMRGYLATGRTEYLAAYRAGARDVDDAADRLLVVRGGGRRVDPELRSIVAEAKTLLRSVDVEIARVRAGRRDAALARLAENDRLLRDLRDRVRTLQAERGIARISALERSRRLWRLAEALVVAAAIPAALLSLFASLAFAGRLVRRAEGLAAKARRIGRGEPIGSPVAGGGEIADVDRALHRMHEELAERQRALARYRLLSEVTRDLILFLDRETLEIIEANQAAAEAYQVPREELIGRSVFTLHEDGKPKAAPVNDDVPEGVIFVRTHRRADGTTFPAEVRAASAEFDGRRIWASTIRDVTERENTRAELVQALGEALEASRLKTEFVAMISHEIRTPMNGVIGMSELLLRTALRDEQREYAATIKESAHSLLAIVDDILDFSKMETGKLELDVAEFDPGRVVEAVAGLLRPAAAAKGVALEVVRSPHLPAAVRGDAGRFRQILVNLVGNAVKFTERGRVRIAIRLGEIDVRGVVLDVAVADTGIGIDAATQQRLFEPFVQGDGRTTRLYGGTGLGLAITKRLVELMDGRIAVESAPGDGSTFRFAIRVQPGDAAALRPADGLRAAEVLVIDDDEATRKGLATAFAAWGMRCEAARDAVEAHAIVRAAEHAGRRFGVVVVDYVLPQANGFELAERLRGEAACDGAAFVLITAFDAEGRRREALVRGFAAYLVKPFSASALHDVVAALGDGASKLARARGVPAAESVAPAGSRGGVRLLLAEDQTINQRVALLQLRELGYDADVAANGADAVRAVSERDYDLVLMDLHMPELDGFGAVRRIREAERESGRHVPIVALTADARDRDREACLAAGMDDYLAKPLQLHALRATLARWLPLTPETACS